MCEIKLITLSIWVHVKLLSYRIRWQKSSVWWVTAVNS